MHDTPEGGAEVTATWAQICRTVAVYRNLGVSDDVIALDVGVPVAELVRRCGARGPEQEPPWSFHDPLDTLSGRANRNRQPAPELPLTLPPRDETPLTLRHGPLDDPPDEHTITGRPYVEPPASGDDAGGLLLAMLLFSSPRRLASSAGARRPPRRRAHRRSGGRRR